MYLIKYDKRLEHITVQLYQDIKTGVLSGNPASCYKFGAGYREQLNNMMRNDVANADTKILVDLLPMLK